MYKFTKMLNGPWVHRTGVRDYFVRVRKAENKVGNHNLKSY